MVGTVGAGTQAPIGLALGLCIAVEQDGLTSAPLASPRGVRTAQQRRWVLAAGDEGRVVVEGAVGRSGPCCRPASGAPSLR